MSQGEFIDRVFLIALASPGSLWVACLAVNYPIASPEGAFGMGMMSILFTGLYISGQAIKAMSRSIQEVKP